jgi:hypothetical protein
MFCLSIELTGACCADVKTVTAATLPSVTSYAKFSQLNGVISMIQCVVLADVTLSNAGAESSASAFLLMKCTKMPRWKWLCMIGCGMLNDSITER